jgi:hypothetical protein
MSMTVAPVRLRREAGLTEFRCEFLHALEVGAAGQFVGMYREDADVSGWHNAPEGAARTSTDCRRRGSARSARCKTRVRYGAGVGPRARPEFPE